MIRDFTLRGDLNDRLEYYAMVVGRNLERELYSFELGGPDRDFLVRFFSRGNELTLDAENVSYRGSGGSFCEYMFGVDMPFDDLTRSDVCNRLIVYGALEDRSGEGLRFTARTEGRESFDSVFLNGNAVSNFFFFLAPADQNLSPLSIQKELLRMAGKKLKRLPLRGEAGSALPAVAHGLREWLADLDPTLFVVQLVQKVHHTYYEECRKAFLAHHDISGPVELGLVARAQQLGIDQYTRERIKIDMVYKHPENKTLIDEYKRLLVEASALDVVPPEVVARLARLRTLSLRRRIPEVILKKLDHRFPLAFSPADLPEGGDYLAPARTVLEGLFLASSAESPLEGGDLDLLVRAKHRATLTHDSAFEELLLETGRKIDEAGGRGERSASGIEHFSTIVTYFDRYDACSESINRLAFIGESRIEAERIRSLRNHREAFDNVSKGLFDECFFEPLAQNQYLSGFGRKKTNALRAGLDELLSGEATYAEVASRLDKIAAAERQYNLLATYFRNNLKLAYLYKNGEPIEAIHQKVNTELFVRGLIKEMLPIEAFHTVLQHILAEDLYLTEVLPQIVESRNQDLRVDFAENSGLDLFRIEELEKEYAERHRLPETALPPIETLPLRRARPATA